MKKLRRILPLFLAVLLLLSACGTGGDGPQGEGNVEQSDVKEINLAVKASPPTGLDPVILSGVDEGLLSSHIYETMFTFDKDGHVINRLCKDYTVSEDGLVYTFQLIDAKWSDGKDITADDFVYAIKRAAGYTMEKETYAYYMRDHIAGGDEVNEVLAQNGEVPVADQDYLKVRAVDPKTLEITLKERCAYFTGLMAKPIFAPLREDFAKESDALWASAEHVQEIPYSGAFVVTEMRDKEKIVLEKNPNYYDADKVKLDRITIYSMPDEQAQLNAFKTGEIDVALSVPVEIVNTYEGNPELVIPLPYVANYYIQVNSKQAPLDNVNVRRALALAVDRDALVKALETGDTKYPLHGMVAKGIPGASGDFREEEDAREKYLDTDIEEAKRLLQQEGYDESNPLQVEYLYNGTQLHSDIAQLLQQMWKNVGVEVTLRSSESKAFWDARNTGDFQLMHISTTADYLDPTNFLDMYLSTTRDDPYFDAPEYDELLGQARKEDDPVKRMELLHQAEHLIIQDEVFFIPLYGYVNPILIRENITGYQTTPMGDTFFMFADIQ